MRPSREHAGNAVDQQFFTVGTAADMFIRYHKP